MDVCICASDFYDFNEWRCLREKKRGKKGKKGKKGEGGKKRMNLCILTQGDWYADKERVMEWTFCPSTIRKKQEPFISW